MRVRGNEPMSHYCRRYELLFPIFECRWAGGESCFIACSAVCPGVGFGPLPLLGFAVELRCHIIMLQRICIAF